MSSVKIDISSSCCKKYYLIHFYAPVGTVTGCGCITRTPLPPPKSSSSSSLKPPPAANQNPNRITTGKKGNKTAHIGDTVSVADINSPSCFDLKIRYEYLFSFVSISEKENTLILKEHMNSRVVKILIMKFYPSYSNNPSNAHISKSP